MLEDLTPAFPLPCRGDLVLLLVSAEPATVLLAARRREEWCRVLRVNDNPDVLFPVTVRHPDGTEAGYQQGEILGWRHDAPRRRVWSWLRRR